MRAAENLPDSDSKVICITRGRRRVDVVEAEILTRQFEETLALFRQLRDRLGPEICEGLEQGR